MEKNGIKKLQQRLDEQMDRLMEQTIPSSIKLEVGRSGALSQNGKTYISATKTLLQVKEMTKKNPKAEETILKEIGVLDA